MPAGELTAPPRAPAPAGVERSLCGWGRTGRARCQVIRPRTAAEVPEALSACARTGAGVIARGAGRSYGDAAQNAGGWVLDTTGLDGVVAIDDERMLITAEAGATVARLMAALAPHGLALPVLPGTRHVTLAGAIASDVHGKNHHHEGTLARHVTAIGLCTPAHGLVEVSPARDPELFHATLGGMGLTGVVVRASIRATPLPSPWMVADVDRTEGLEQTLALMSSRSGPHPYSVAWLDLLAEGPHFGRAIVSRADHLYPGVPADYPLRGSYPRSLGRRPFLEVPRGLPAALLRPAGMRAFNALRWRTSPRRERKRTVALTPYFFPLDALGEWNRLYGPGGLWQYQFVVPAGREQELLDCFELIRTRRLPVYLAVFKRLGPASAGPLSFPLEGFTLAIDMPAAAPGVAETLSELDELLAGCGGRVYLSKDARLRAETVRAMYPRLGELEGVRGRVDPDGALRSDLARRLELCEPSA